MTALPKSSTALPASARTILARIDVEDESTNAHARTERELIRGDKQRRDELQRDLDRNRKAGLYEERTVMQKNGLTGTDRAAHHILAKQEAEIAGLSDKIAIRETRLAARVKGRKTGAMLRSELSKFEAAGCTFEAAEPVTPQLRKGEILPSALARFDRDIDAKRAAKLAAKTANRTTDEVKAKAVALIDSMAQRGRPDISAALKGGPITLPKMKIGRDGYHFKFADDGAALVAWLFRDELVAKLETLIGESIPDDFEAMTVADAMAAIGEAEDELLALHRERAAIVEAIIANGGECAHRPDAPAEAVLGIEIH